MINIVKLLFLFLAGASTVYGFSVMPVKELKDGYIYIHTARNKPSITVGGKKIDAKEGMFVKAESAELKCAENQRIFFILSNRTVVQMDENSEIKIESFKQAMPFSSNFKDDYESTRSETVFSAGKGNFIFYTARLRATSVMKINSPYGSFDIQSREFELKISDTGAKISLIDGPVGLQGSRRQNGFPKKQTKRNDNKVALERTLSPKNRIYPRNRGGNNVGQICSQQNRIQFHFIRIRQRQEHQSRTRRAKRVFNAPRQTRLPQINFPDAIKIPTARFRQDRKIGNTCGKGSLSVDTEGKAGLFENTKRPYGL